MNVGKKLLALALTFALLATMGVCALAEGETRMTVKCVDTEGSIIRENEEDALDLSKDQVVDASYPHPEIEGYTYQKTTVDGEELQNLTISHDADNNPVLNAVVGEGEAATEKTLTGSETLLFVYEKKAEEHVHSFDEGKVTQEPTCTEAGVKTYTCECGETKTEEIAALGHDFDEGEVTKEATCTEAGVKTYTCKNCSETKTEEIAALGHDFDEGKVTKEATCTEAGVKTYTCKNCSETKTEEIPALGHDFDEGKVTKEPTCTEAGVKTYTCKNGGETKTEEIAALGHDFDEGKVTKKATCTEDGVKTYTCKRCNETKTETIKKLGHDYAHGRCKNCDIINPNFKPTLSDATNGHANWGSDYVFRSNAARKDYQKVLVDGKEPAADAYRLWEDDGDTGITLKGEFVKTLKAGDHEVSIVSVTGTATKTINVSDKPKTGDTGAGLWAGLLVLSTLGCGAVALTAKKKFGTR